MTFFYDLNKKLDEIRATPSTTHGQLNERDMGKHNNKTTGFDALAKKAGKEYGSKAAGERVAGAQFQKMKKAGKLEEQGMGDVVKKVGSAVKKVGGAVLNRLGHGDDQAMRKDLQRKMGVPQTGKKPTSKYNTDPIPKDAVYDPFHDDDKFDAAYAAGKKQVKEKMSPARAKSFAALAPPKDKITFADKIAGAKKEVDEMLGDVAAEAIKGVLSPKKKKIDMNKNGKLDANDFAMLRKGGNKQVADEGGVDPVRAKLAKAIGKYFDKIYSYDDSGLDIMDSMCPTFNRLLPKYGNDLDKMGQKAPVDVLKRLAQELKACAEECDLSLEEGWDEMEKDVKSRMGARKVGDVTHGDKHDTQEVPGGRRVTRRVDPNTGYSVGADSDAPADGEKRGRGRPKSAGGPRQERVTAKSRKADRTAYSKKKTNEDDFDITDRGEYDQEGEMAKDDIKTIVRHAQALQKVLGDNDNLPEWVQAKLAKIESMMTAVDDYMQNQDSDQDDEMSVGEEKTPTRDNRAERAGKKVTKDIEYDEKKKDGIHGKKRGSEDDRAEKAGKRVTKDIEYDEKKDKPKKVKEQGGTDTPTASSGFSYGQGIYDSMNHELETMIRESMNVSMSMNTDANGGPSKSITVTATDDDAMKLGELLKNAGLGGHDYPNVEGGADMDHPGAIEVNGTMDAEGAEQLAQQIRQAMGDHGHEHDGGEACDTCGQEDCGCEQEVDEAYGDDAVSQNSPDFPSNTETSHDAFQYSGGLNKPKSSGMATIPVTDVQVDGEDKFASIARLREMAGIKEAKKPDFPDVDNDGNKKETIEKALDDKKTAGDKKVAESLMAELARFKKA